MNSVYKALFEAIAYAAAIGIILQFWAILPIALQVPLAVCIIVLAANCAANLIAAAIIYSKVSEK